MYYFPNRLMDDDRQHQKPSDEEPTTPETEPRETVEEPSTEVADS